MRIRALLAASALAGVLAAAATASAAAATITTATVNGTEVPPISSTLGTFVGVAGKPLRASWRVQIDHQPLATGPTVAITGGSYSFLTLSRRILSGPVTGGSVTVVDRGSHCANQTYEVSLQLAGGSFDGTLTHHRRSLLGRCVLYAATIHGRATLTG